MAIGTYGKRVFATFDRRILTFRDFAYTTTPRFAEHDIISNKPIMEYLGPGLDDITFSITLRADMGINVRTELEEWRKSAAVGSAERLIIGKTRLGSSLWCIMGCSEAWGVVTNLGAIISASVDVTMREYIAELPTSRATIITEKAPETTSAAAEIGIGDVVQFSGGQHYASSASTTATGGRRTPGTAKVTNTAKTAIHQYHLIGVTSNVYGWVDASTISKG